MSGLSAKRIFAAIASKTRHIEQAVQALDVSLSAEKLSSLAAPHPVLGH